MTWKTIEKIAEFSAIDSYRGKVFPRRPELLITFMTYTMQRRYKISEEDREKIDKSLGTDIWREKVKDYEKKNVPVYWAFLETFLDKLGEYYNKEKAIKWFPVKEVITEAPIYFIILASTHPLAQQITFKNFESYIKREFREVDHAYQQEKARREHGKLLIDYFDINNKK